MPLFVLCQDFVDGGAWKEQDELQSRTRIFTIGRVRRKKDDVVDVV